MKPSQILNCSFILLFGITVQAADSKNLAENEFLIRTKVARLELVGPDGNAHAIRISFPGSTIPAQTIDCRVEHVELLMDSGLKFETHDYDGDGFRDFSIFDLTGTTRNPVVHYYFWSPGKRSFSRRKDFRAEKINHFDPKTRIFKSSWRLGGIAGWCSFYVLDFGKLRKTKTLITDYGHRLRKYVPHPDESQMYEITIIRRRDGTTRTFYRRPKGG